MYMFSQKKQLCRNRVLGITEKKLKGKFWSVEIKKKDQPSLIVIYNCRNPIKGDIFSVFKSFMMVSSWRATFNNILLLLK